MVANALDSTPADGNQGTPNPDNSGQQDVKPNSTPANQLSPEQLNALVDGAIEKRLSEFRQITGNKDRRLNQVEQQLRDFSPVLERVKSILTPEQQAEFAQIQRDAEFEELKQAVYGKPSAPTGAAPGGTQGGAAVDVEAVVASLKFEPNDPALAALKIKYGSDPKGLVAAAADLRLSQLTSPSPTPGTGMPPGGGGPAGSPDYNALAAEYETLAVNPAANFERMTQIQQELDKLK